jgi:hypothetical protein
LDDERAEALPLCAEVSPGGRLNVIQVVLHVVDCVVLVTRLPVHASEPFHRLNGHEITAVLVVNLLLSTANTCFVIWRTADMSVPVDSAVVPCAS